MVIFWEIVALSSVKHMYLVYCLFVVCFFLFFLFFFLFFLSFFISFFYHILVSGLVSCYFRVTE